VPRKDGVTSEVTSVYSGGAWLALVAAASVPPVVAVVVKLWIRQNFARYVLDQSAKQSVRIDPMAVIQAFEWSRSPRFVGTNGPEVSDPTGKDAPQLSERS